MKITIDDANMKIKDGKVYIEFDADKLADLMGERKVELSTLNPGDKFLIGDERFIVLEHTCDGVRVIAENFAYSDMTFGDNSDWKESYIRRVLHDEYFQKIAAIVGEKNIIPMVRDLTSMDGLDDYLSCTDKISMLTFAEYAKYHKILGLKPNYPDWWWLITACSTPSNDYSRSVCCVGSCGSVDWSDCGGTGGVRPFLNLDSSILVLVDNT